MSLLIDLEFDHLMNSKELKSTSIQMGLVYSATRKSKVPINTSFIGFGDVIRQTLSQSYPEYENWNINFSSETLETYPSENLVYLTGDSDHELTHLSSESTYVIGGLVDHNRHKNICLNKAHRLGIQHARLPISRYMKIHSRSILTINQVVEILAMYLNTKDWKLSFEACIPQRKRVKDLGNSMKI